MAQATEEPKQILRFVCPGICTNPGLQSPAQVRTCMGEGKEGEELRALKIDRKELESSQSLFLLLS